jgi:hypothetical protein
VVHYVSFGTPGGEYGKECRAAIVTQELDGVDGGQTVGLCVLNPSGMFFNRMVGYDAGSDWIVPDGQPTPALCTGLEHKGGSWHWPERV